VQIIRLGLPVCIIERKAKLVADDSIDYRLEVRAEELREAIGGLVGAARLQNRPEQRIDLGRSLVGRHDRVHVSHGVRTIIISWIFRFRA